MIFLATTWCVSQSNLFCSCLLQCQALFAMTLRHVWDWYLKKIAPFYVTLHTFKNAKGTSNKNVYSFETTFLHSFCTPFGLCLNTMKIKAWLDWMLKNFDHSEGGFLGKQRTKQTRPWEKAWNNEPENGVGSWCTFLYEGTHASGKMCFVSEAPI